MPAGSAPPTTTSCATPRRPPVVRSCCPWVGGASGSLPPPDHARRPGRARDPAEHRLHRPPLRGDRRDAPPDRAARLRHHRPPPASRRARLLAPRRPGPSPELGSLRDRAAARTPPLLLGPRRSLVHHGALPGGRSARLRRREPRAAARHPRCPRARHLRHPDRQRARPEPEPRNRSRRRPLRGAPPGRQGLMRGPRLLLAAALVAGCAAVPLPRRSAYHPSDADLSVTRIVHGSVILEMRGTRVIVDPWFDSGWVVRQQEPLGLTPDGLPSLAAVLVTHRHRDHFDPDALRRLAATVPEVVARPELHARLVSLRFQRATDLGWWGQTPVGDVHGPPGPARHGVPENGYVLRAGRLTADVAGVHPYF